MDKLNCKENFDINICTKIQFQVERFKVFLLFPNLKGQVRFSIFDSWILSFMPMKVQPTIVNFSCFVNFKGNKYLKNYLNLTGKGGKLVYLYKNNGKINYIKN